ncbi:MAG: DUF11 domain-containing protein, partial [Chloroflexota bacterium]
MNNDRNSRKKRQSFKFLYRYGFIGLILVFLFSIPASIAAASIDETVSSDNDLEPAADFDTNATFITTIPTGSDNIDTPLEEFATFSGNIDVATGGVSFFTNGNAAAQFTSNDFTVDIPACVSGNQPVINGAYLEWYNRWRGANSIIDIPNGVPTFDPSLNVGINGSTLAAFATDETYFARFISQSNNSFSFIRRNAIIDVTNLLATEWVAGTNLISITGADVATPNSTNPNVNNSENFGVGIHVFFSCPEYEDVTISYNVGLDWFYGTQDAPFAGDFSDLVCLAVPADTAARQVDIDAILGGQAEENAPFRGAQLYYQTGTGTPPTVDSTDATGPAGTIVNGGTQIGTGFEDIWISSLGQEWDQLNADNIITIPAGDEWVCLQAFSVQGNGSLAGISGDLLGVAFSVSSNQPTTPADWGDLPDGPYNTDSTGVAGPSHPIIPELQIGATIDDETNGQPNATATGDGDDEDGIILPAVVKPGNNATFTATVTNTTGTDAFLYGFVDWNGDGDFDDLNEVISQTIPTASNGLELTFTYAVPITAATGVDLGIRFRISTDDDLGPDGPATNGEVEDYLYQLMPFEYDLALIKRIVTPGPYKVGDQVTFQIMVMNQGQLDSGDFTVADTLPAEMTYVSSNPAAAVTPGVGNTGVITWTDTGLAIGDIVTYSITAEIASLPAGPIDNIAEITSDSGDDDDSDPTDNSDESDTFNDDDVTNDQDPNDQDDSDFESITVEIYDLALIKRLVTPRPYTIGQEITHTISVMNQGTIDSGQFTVTDTLPVELAFVSAIPAPTASPTGTGGVVEWTTANLAPGEITTYTVVVTIDSPPTTGNTIKNTAEITSDSGEDKDSDPTDGSAERDDFNDDDVTNDQDPNDQDDSDFEIVDLSEYDLALIKRVVSQGPFAIGQEVTYTLSVMNQGNVNSGVFTVTDSLPNELDFVSAIPAPVDSPTSTGGTITWVTPDLAPGAITTYTVVVTIDAAAQPGTDLVNTAEIVGDSGDDEDSDPTDGSGQTDTFNDDDVTNDQDPNDEDDSDFESITVAEYDLALIKRIVTPRPYSVGQEITYTISVMNQGNIDSGQFTVTDTLPIELAFVSAIPAPTASPTGTGGVIEWTTANLAPGEITTYTVVVNIDSAPAVGTIIKNTAEITSDSGDDNDSDPTDGSAERDDFNDDDVTNDQDPNDQDDSDFEEIDLAEYDLALIKQIVTAGPYTVGDELTYVISVMNQGNVNSGVYTVTDSLPSSLTFVSAAPAPDSDPGVGNSGDISWVTSNLVPGDITTYTVTVTIDASAVPSSTIKNTAEIVEDSGDDEDSDPTDGSGNTDDFNDDDVTNDQDPNDQDDSDFEEIVVDNYDLALIKQITTPGPYAIGDQISYIISVMNQGTLDSGVYTVTDYLPAELSFVSA